MVGATFEGIVRPENINNNPINLREFVSYGDSNRFRVLQLHWGKFSKGRKSSCAARRGVSVGQTWRWFNLVFWASLEQAARLCQIASLFIYCKCLMAMAQGAIKSAAMATNLPK